MLSSDIAALQVCDATPYRRSDFCDLPEAHFATAAFEFRLQAWASFPEKLLQTVVKGATKRAQNMRPLVAFRTMPHSRRMRALRLTLRELERLARLGAAVFLALDAAGVAGQEAALLQHRTQV